MFGRRQKRSFIISVYYQVLYFSLYAFVPIVKQKNTCLEKLLVAAFDAGFRPALGLRSPYHVHNAAVEFQKINAVRSVP